jgi:signal transduction histidine kinase
MKPAERSSWKIILIKWNPVTKPIELYDPKTGNVLQKVYYTHSSLVDKLQYFPLVAILIISVYVFIGYLAFSTTRNHEQSKIWVGMAKEAAHQMGTPLSSLMAWMEILKYGKEEPETINSTLGEMENDVSRLSTIATRFSKIGSLPEKELFDLAELVENVCVYFDKRLPHLGKKVEIVRNFTGPKMAMVNKDLIAWVFENLLKNAAEAIESKSGTITISMREITGNKIYVYVKDNGKGMQPKYKKTVFYPGFSTKKRGWGLGLSLSKRIIEEYHSGKIYIKETVSGKGTTFAIEIPVDS